MSSWERKTKLKLSTLSHYVTTETGLVDPVAGADWCRDGQGNKMSSWERKTKLKLSTHSTRLLRLLAARLVDPEAGADWCRDT